MWIKLIPTIVSVLPLVLAPFSDALTSQIQKNPYVYMGLQSALTVLANLVKSPLPTQK